jgi:hypothetical protein
VHNQSTAVTPFCGTHLKNCRLLRLPEAVIENAANSFFTVGGRT